MATFDNLELVKEYPSIFLKGTKPLRVYRSKTIDDKDKAVTYRYHFGYPKELMEHLCPLIETTPFWGEQHWTEIDGFWLWWTRVMTHDETYPADKLNDENKFRRAAFANYTDFLRRATQ